MEYISKKFTLGRGNKLELRLDSPIELPGNKWYCGLKEFSLEQKWSLANDYITIHYQNGSKSVIKPGFYHSVENVDKVLEEMFYNPRQKRDVVGDITGVGDEDEDEEEPQVIIVDDEDDEDSAEEKTTKKPETVEKATENVAGKQETSEKKTEEKPVVVTENPVVVTEKPIVITENPVVVTEKPIVITENPVAVTEKPVVITEKPVVITEKPVVVTENPVVVTEKPIVVTEKPVVENKDDSNKTKTGKVKSLVEQFETNTEKFEINRFYPPEIKDRKEERVQNLFWTAPKKNDIKSKIPVSTPVDNGVKVTITEDYTTKYDWGEDSHYNQPLEKNFKSDTENPSEGIYPVPEKPIAEAFIFDDDTDTEEEGTHPPGLWPSKEKEADKTVGKVMDESEYPPGTHPDPNDVNKEKVGEKENEVAPFSYPEPDDSNLPSILSDEKVGEHENVADDSYLPTITSDEKVGEHENVTHEDYPAITSNEKDAEHENVADDSNLPAITSDENGGKSENIARDDIVHPKNDIKSEVEKEEALPFPTPTEPPSILPLPTEPPSILPLPTETTEKLLPTSELPLVVTPDPPKTKDPEKEKIDPEYVNPFTNDFTKNGFESIKFNKNYGKNYILNFDPKFVTAIELSSGFAKVLGFSTNLLYNNTIAFDKPTTETPVSHICISIKNILRPLMNETKAEVVTIPINDKDKAIYSYFSTPIWFKLETTRIDFLSLEFTDFFDNPIACDNAHGHFVLVLSMHKH